MLNLMTDTKTHWQNIYSQKQANSVTWFQSNPDTSLGLIKNSQIAKNAPILDVGSGASLLIDSLLNKGFTELSVLDISSSALAASKQRLGSLAEKITWYEADITQFVPETEYSLWHDRAVFHFLTDKADRKKYIDCLKSALKVNGHVIIATFALDGPKKCSGLEVVHYDVSKMSSELGDDFTFVEVILEKHITPLKNVQKFIYFHFIKNK